MDLIGQVKAVDLMLKFLRGDMQRITPYPFVPMKPAFEPNAAFGLPTSTPEEEGVSSEYLRQFFEEMDACRGIHPHSVMVLRHGKLIAAGSWKPFTNSVPHMMFSLSKSVTCMAVGLAVDEGLFSLEDKIVSFFPEKAGRPHNRKIESVTVLHLLNMTSGANLNEFGSEVERDWLRAFFAADCAVEPGSGFDYNSMNSYILSAIVCRKSGQTLTEYLTPRLFEPLGIPPVHWDTCPAGIEKGGWGLYLRPIDMAKLGQLFLQKGKWEADGRLRTLIPEKWVEAATDTAVPTHRGGHTSHYGYQIWSFNAEEAYQYNGIFGQYVIVLPKQDMVLAITSGNQNLFSDGSSDLVERFFGDAAPAFSASALPRNVKELARLRRVTENLYAVRETAPLPEKPAEPAQGLLQRVFGKRAEKRNPPELPAAAELSAEALELEGRVYRLEKSFGSLMPLICAAVTNNFSGCVAQVGFSFREPGTLALTVWEEEKGGRNVLLAGLDGVPRRGMVSVNGEQYNVGATARLTRDEDGRLVVKVFVSFIESPSTRIFKFIFYRSAAGALREETGVCDRVMMRLDEVPSVSVACQMLLGLFENDPAQGPAPWKRLGESIVQQKLSGRMSALTKPRARGVLLPPRESAGKPEEGPVQTATAEQCEKS